MSLRNRKGIWHYRFKFDGKEQSGTTRLAATERNTMAALRKEAEHRQALITAAVTGAFAIPGEAA